MRVYHVISKLIGDLEQKNDYHSWKELVKISKIVKFGKDRFTNSVRRYEFLKIEILYENSLLVGKSCLQA